MPLKKKSLTLEHFMGYHPGQLKQIFQGKSFVRKAHLKSLSWRLMMKESAFWARVFFSSFLEGSSCIHNFLCLAMWSKTFYYLLIVVVFYIIFFIPFWILILFRREATSTDYCVRPSKRPLCSFWARYFFLPLFGKVAAVYITFYALQCGQRLLIISL